jgi:uncharacterized protein YdaU (DUF1376 family)
MKEFIRNPPAFQFYPSNYMSAIQYRTMSLSERGLMMSMLCECWVNSYVPSDISQLAKILGYSNDEVSQSLSTNVMQFFYKDDDKIVCPELLAYKQKLDSKRAAQIEGGIKGAKLKKEKEINARYPQGQPEGSLIEHKIDKYNLTENNIKKQVFIEDDMSDINISEENKEWLKGYDKSPGEIEK